MTESDFDTESDADDDEVNNDDYNVSVFCLIS